jgi:hypothetical protein
MKQILTLLAFAVMTVSSYAGVAIGTVTTSATGTTFVPLASEGQATEIHLINDSGTSIEVRLGGEGDTFDVATGVGFTIDGVKALSQVEVRRSDTSNTQVTFSYVYETND